MFFDLDANKSAIRSAYYKVPELADLVARVERDVLARYTVRKQEHSLLWPWAPFGQRDDDSTEAPKLKVFLRGYNADPTLADAHLVQALIDTIADVANWRLAQLTNSPIEQMRSAAGAATVTFRQSANEPYPPRWTQRLVEFDARPKPIGC